MKRHAFRLLATLMLGAGLGLTNSASAYEHRTINGYDVLVNWPYGELTDEDHTTSPYIIVNNKKGKPVPESELNDRRKTDVHMKVHYYGPEDRAENYWAKPVETLDTGRFGPQFYAGLITGTPVRMAAPGAYGIELSGLLNGRYFNELFVCGKGTQDPEGGILDCTIAPVAFPGAPMDAYRQSTRVLQ
ncbi:MAG: hypothetical protein U1E83_00545 [Methylotetracoccus sp.]